VSGPAWFSYGHDAQHTGGQRDRLARSRAHRVVVGGRPRAAVHAERRAAEHYGSPVVTTRNTVVIPVKTTAAGGYRVEGRNGATVR
jgi:hypothetical protein